MHQEGLQILNVLPIARHATWCICLAVPAIHLADKTPNSQGMGFETLNEAKTHIVDATEASFNFLGFTLQMSRGAKTGKPYPNVRPADKSLKKIKARLTELTGRELTAIPLGDLVTNVNRSLRGWANYFDYGADTNLIVPDEAPHVARESYEKAVKSAKPKAIRNVRNALMADGFTVVRLCGMASDGSATQDDAGKEGHAVRTHWRRGHWRMQPCGPKLSQIKRVWVRPTLVGKDAGGAVKGHVYSVDGVPVVK